MEAYENMEDKKVLPASSTDYFDLYEGLIPSDLLPAKSNTEESSDGFVPYEPYVEGEDEHWVDAKLEPLSIHTNISNELSSASETTVFASDITADEKKKFKFKSHRAGHRRTTYIRKEVPLFFGIPPIIPDLEDQKNGPFVVIIHNLGWWINDIELRNEALTIGPIRALKILDNPMDGRSTGMALIEYMKREDAEKAITRLQNKFDALGDRPIVIQILLERICKSIESNTIHWSCGGPLSEEQLQELFSLSPFFNASALNNKSFKPSEPSTVDFPQDHISEPSTLGTCVETASNGFAHIEAKGGGEGLDIAKGNPSHPLFPWFNPAVLDVTKYQKRRKVDTKEDKSSSSEEKHSRHKKKKAKKKKERQKKRKKHEKQESDSEASFVTEQSKMPFFHRPQPFIDSVNYRNTSTALPEASQSLRLDPNLNGLLNARPTETILPHNAPPAQQRRPWPPLRTPLYGPPMPTVSGVPGEPIGQHPYDPRFASAADAAPGSTAFYMNPPTRPLPSMPPPRYGPAAYYPNDVRVPPYAVAPHGRLPSGPRYPPRLPNERAIDMHAPQIGYTQDTTAANWEGYYDAHPYTAVNDEMPSTPYCKEEWKDMGNPSSTDYAAPQAYRSAVVSQGPSDFQNPTANAAHWQRRPSNVLGHY